MMERRNLLAGMGAVVIFPPAAEGQPAAKVPRVGVVVPGNPKPGSLQIEVFEAFRQGLRELGYVERRTIIVEPRWDHNLPDRYAALASELVKLEVDVIVAGTTPASLAAKRATTTIPIVMAATGAADPVALGLVASFSRPGGNVTGLTLQTQELPGKRLELLKEAIPGIRRVALFWYATPYSPTQVKEHEAAGRALGLEIQSLEIRFPDEFNKTFQAAVRDRAQALIMTQGALYATHRTTIAGLALKYRLPSISGETGYGEAGGLMNYGPNIAESWRRAAGYVDRILKGAKPGDLPIEQPTKFELAINLKTAKALGLTIPPSLLLRADQVIES